MNLIKIGKFIADCRKKKNITQEQLAEKLNITDRAVSKWERGLSLPDADKMISLCNILGISVNELLIGEKINMKDYNKKTDELLVELAKQEEIRNKKTMSNMWVMGISSLIFYLGIVVLANYCLEEGSLQTGVVCSATVFFILVCLYLVKLEAEAGYYECNECHERFKPSYYKVLMAPHVHTTRYLKCPKCNKRSWSKKVMTKE